MKNSQILIVIFLLLASGCVDHAYDEFQFTMFNDTDKDLIVLGFSNHLDPKTNGRAAAILIGSGTSYTVTRVNGINSDIGMGFYSIKGGGVDSVRIIFDRQKLLVYTWEDARDGDEKANSIFDGKKTGKYAYSHHITEEDYAQAVDCGEDCF